MSTAIQPATGHTRDQKRAKGEQVIVYGHSALLYWWPLWAAGYVMALLTWVNHEEAVIGSKREWFHPSQNLGVVYALILLLLIVVTSSRIKGMKAALIITALAFVRFPISSTSRPLPPRSR